MNRKPNLPTIIWALIILILCGIPGKDIPHISFLELLSFDKFVHAGIFFILFFFAVRGFRLQEKFPVLKKHAALIAFISASAYGGLTEILQATVFSGRSADVFDFIADSFGCFAALLFYPLVSRKLPKLHLPL
jgi:hypothetical protein